MATTYEPLVSASLSSAGTSITVSSIPTTGYTDLVVVINHLAYYASGTYLTGGLQVGNGSIDTATNYSNTYLYGDGTTAGSSYTNTNAYVRYIDIPATPTDNGSRGSVIINIMNYANTSYKKTMLIRSNSVQSSTGTNMLRTFSATWQGTSAINTIKFTNIDGTNFYAGTTIAVYGIKAA